MKSHIENILDVHSSNTFSHLPEPLSLTRSFYAGGNDEFVACVTNSMAPFTKYFYLLNEGKKYPIRRREEDRDDKMSLLNEEQYHLYHLGNLLASAIRQVYPQPNGMKNSKYILSLDDQVDKKGIFEIRKIFLESLSRGFVDEKVEEMTPKQLFIFRKKMISSSPFSSFDNDVSDEESSPRRFKFVRRNIPKYEFSISNSKKVIKLGFVFSMVSIVFYALVVLLY